VLGQHVGALLQVHCVGLAVKCGDVRVADNGASTCARFLFTQPFASITGACLARIRPHCSIGVCDFSIQARALALFHTHATIQPLSFWTVAAISTGRVALSLVTVNISARQGTGRSTLVVLEPGRTLQRTKVGCSPSLERRVVVPRTDASVQRERVAHGVLPVRVIRFVHI